MEQEIKYAIAVVNKPNRVSFYPESEDKIIGYIISKVIVAREETKYSDGVEYKAYDVLLPYTGVSNKKEEVIYDRDGNPVNTTRIYRIYNTYEEALAEKKELNKKVRFIVTSNELKNKKSIDKCAQYNMQMHECDIIESVIDSYCKDLKTKQMQRVLV
jgi:hypothetical protein